VQKTAEPIEMPFGSDSGWSKEACIRCSARWRHLANTTEPYMCGGDAACCQIIPTLVDQLLNSINWWYSAVNLLYCHH